MPMRSAGLLIFRRITDGVEVLLVHPGGPFWANKDEGAWSIPKGVDPGEEELGVDIDGSFHPLGEYRQPGGKTVVAWCIEADPILDVDEVQSSTFTMEWPPKSGLVKSFPEVDRAGWFSIDAAKLKILKGQLPMLVSLGRHLAL